MTSSEVPVPEPTEESEGFLTRSRARLIGVAVGIVAVVSLGISVVEGFEKKGEDFSNFIQDFDGDTVQEMLNNAKPAD